MKRIVLGLAALAAIFLAHPAYAQGISQKVAPCNWSFPTRCVAVNADGSVPVSPVAGTTGDVNLKQVNGATVNVGAGAAGTGTQRVTTSTDSTIGTITAPVGVKGIDGATIASGTNQSPVAFVSTTGTLLPAQGTSNDALAEGNNNSASAGPVVNAWVRMHNGATGSRAYQITATDGTGVGVTAVEQAGGPYSNIKTATTTAVKAGAGILHKIVVNTPVANGVVTVYDSLAGSGNTIATITMPATLLSQGPQTATYDLRFATGLTIVTTGTPDITVVYR